MKANFTRMMSTVISITIFGLLIVGARTNVVGQGHSELDQQLAHLRAVTARYHDINNALADGFTPVPGGW